MTPLRLLVLSGLVAALSAVGVAFVRGYALRRDLLDHPNERSSHTVPTPRGGGVVIAVAWLLSLAALAQAGLLEARTFVALGGGGAAVALTGWLDDRINLRASVRLVVQLLAAAWTVAWLGGLPEVGLGSVTLHLGVWGAVPAVLGLVWLANLYNFMDGIDGLAGSEAVVAGTTAAVLLSAAGAPGLAAASAVAAASSLGFLVWNWQPARVFMGDVGSVLLGYAFGATALAAQARHEVSVVALLLPLGLFVMDATFTLARRAGRGERLWVAHRTHVYQRLAASGWSHRRVTSLAVALNVLLAGAAVLAHTSPPSLPWATAAAAAMLVLAGWCALRVSGAAGRDPEVRRAGRADEAEVRTAQG